MLDGKPVTAKHTPESLRAAECDGKERFTRHRLAMRCAQRAGRREKVKMSVYLCRFCKGYHVGQDMRKPQKFEPLTEAEDFELLQIDKLNKLRKRT